MTILTPKTTKEHKQSGRWPAWNSVNLDNNHVMRGFMPRSDSFMLLSGERRLHCEYHYDIFQASRSSEMA
jgi:hypothetical protein